MDNNSDPLKIYQKIWLLSGVSPMRLVMGVCAKFSLLHYETISNDISEIWLHLQEASNEYMLIKTDIYLHILLPLSKARKYKALSLGNGSIQGMG